MEPLVSIISPTYNDEDTIENETVTIRDRDTMKQITLPIEEAVKYVEERVKF